MMHEDPPPPPRRRFLDPRVLDTLGIAELEDYIGELRAEIGRAEATIDRKRGHRGLAESVFGKKR